jgi:hypothetical protein
VWQISIRSKIILTLLLTGLACLAAGAIIGYRAGETALMQSVGEQLTAQREIKRRRIESYAVIEAGRAVPDLAEPDGVKCFVTGIGEGTIKYNVVLSVANPGLLDVPRDEFLSRFWYLAQRRGLRLDPSPEPNAAARLRMLEEGGVFHRDADALPQLAEASAFRRYRRGDLLWHQAPPQRTSSSSWQASWRLRYRPRRARTDSNWYRQGS